MPTDNGFLSGLTALFSSDRQDPPKLPSADVQNVMKAVMGGLQPGTLEYFEALGAGGTQNGILPTTALGPFGSIRDAYSSDAQNIMKKQHALTTLGTKIQADLANALTLQMAQQVTAPTLGAASAIMPALAATATPAQQIRPLTGRLTVPTELVPPTFDIEQLQPDAQNAARRDAAYTRYALGSGPGEIASGGLTDVIRSGAIAPIDVPSLLPPDRTLDVYGELAMDPTARMNPAQVAAYNAMLAGHVVDPSARLQPPALESARISRQGAMDREMLSAEQQQNVLRNMVVAGHLDETTYRKMLPNLQQPLQKAAFDTFLREMTAGSTISKSSNELAEALFGKPYDQLAPDELVTPADRTVFKNQFQTELPKGPMTRRLALSRLKTQDIPKNIQQFKTEEQIRAAGPVTYNRGSAELDLPLGGQANIYRRLLPSGEIETAPTTMSHRTANELGYVDVSKFKQDVQAVPDLEVLESQTRELEKYATELIKADSGIGRFIQGGKIALDKLTQGGKLTGIPKPDGSPGFLTVGEAANLYDTQVQSMLEYYARNLRGVRGAATEGDVARMSKAFASVWDTKTAKEQKFKEVHDFIQEVKDASLKTVFGKTVQHLPDLGELSDAEVEFAAKAKSLGMSKATVAEELQRRRRRR